MRSFKIITNTKNGLRDTGLEQRAGCIIICDNWQT